MKKKKEQDQVVISCLLLTVVYKKAAMTAAPARPTPRIGRAVTAGAASLDADAEVEELLLPLELAEATKVVAASVAAAEDVESEPAEDDDDAELTALELGATLDSALLELITAVEKVDGEEGEETAGLEEATASVEEG